MPLFLHAFLPQGCCTTGNWSLYISVQLNRLPKPQVGSYWERGLHFYLGKAHFQNKPSIFLIDVLDTLLFSWKCQYGWKDLDHFQFISHRTKVQRVKHSDLVCVWGSGWSKEGQVTRSAFLHFIDAAMLTLESPQWSIHGSVLHLSEKWSRMDLNPDFLMFSFLPHYHR